jgi:hypothetical protein
MKEQLIEFETAKLAKEKGFSLWTNERFYGKTYDKNTAKSLYTNTSFMMYENNNTPKNDSPTYDAPTQSLLQKWLRDKFIMDVQPICTYKTFRFYHLGIIFINDKNQIDTILIKDEGMPTNKLFNSYEEALEEGLFETLKLIP